ncbi:MAG: hypothetical protein HW410_1514 [Nitrosarchaeum sp.]|nr:hypothetical protein [Nitrosarchaeum sp.]
MIIPTSNAKSLNGIRVRKQNRNLNNLPSAPNNVEIQMENI